MQAGDASGTGLFDTPNRCYDDDRMASIDNSLHSYFPELIGPNEVRSKAADRCLLPQTPPCITCSACPPGIGHA